MQRTQQQWLTLFQAQNNGDLKIKDFCFEQGISPSSFYKHKAISKASEEKSPSPFSQVQLVEPDSKPSHHAIELSVGNVNMTFSEKTNVRWLASLVGKLV